MPLTSPHPSPLVSRKDEGYTCQPSVSSLSWIFQKKATWYITASFHHWWFSVPVFVMIRHVLERKKRKEGRPKSGSKIYKWVLENQYVKGSHKVNVKKSYKILRKQINDAIWWGYVVGPSGYPIMLAVLFAFISQFRSLQLPVGRKCSKSVVGRHADERTADSLFTAVVANKEGFRETLNQF